MDPVTGGIVAAGVGGLVSGVGSYFSGKQSADFSKAAYKHRYQWMMSDLRKAGLNPMLAMGASPGNVPQPDFPNVGEAAVKGGTEGALAQAQIASAREQANLARTTANKTGAEGEAQEMQNLITRSDPKYIAAAATVDKSGQVAGPSAVAQQRWDAELKTIQETARKATTDADLSKLNAELAQGNVTLQQLRIKYADELTAVELAYKRAMKDAARANVPAAQADAAFWQNAGELGKWASYIKSLFN